MNQTPRTETWGMGKAVSGTEGPDRSCTDFYRESFTYTSDTILQPLAEILHELRDALRAQRDHLDDMQAIVGRLCTRLIKEGGQSL